LRELGHRISFNTVRSLLDMLGYSLQANRKTREGSSHPDRDAQFGYINAQVKAALAASEPAISVDTKKKELVGDFKNAGREWRPKGEPEAVRIHDFLIRGHRRECRLGQRRHRPRHGQFCGQRYSPLVAVDGGRPLSQRQASHHHR
jgi:hypothetical protein